MENGPYSRNRPVKRSTVTRRLRRSGGGPRRSTVSSRRRKIRGTASRQFVQLTTQLLIGLCQPGISRHAWRVSRPRSDCQFPLAAERRQQIVQPVDAFDERLAETLDRIAGLSAGRWKVRVRQRWVDVRTFEDSRRAGVPSRVWNRAWHQTRWRGGWPGFHPLFLCETKQLRGPHGAHFRCGFDPVLDVISKATMAQLRRVRSTERTF